MMIIAGISAIGSNDKPDFIAQLWHDFHHQGISKKLPHKVSEDIVVVYTRYQGDYTRPYTLIIGHQVTQVSGQDFDHVSFDSSKHTIYDVKGPLPQAVLDQWVAIWQMTAPRAYRADYEIYRADGAVVIGVEFI